MDPLPFVGRDVTAGLGVLFGVGALLASEV
jgi:hypothetical protein